MTNTSSMKILVLLSFALVSMFYINDVYAQENSVNSATISISISADTTQLEYENGDEITIEGIINDYDPSLSGAVYYGIATPTNSIITDVGALHPNNDGTFEKTFVAGDGQWPLVGEYVLHFRYSESSDEVAIDYIGGRYIEDVQYELENQIKVRVNDIPYVIGHNHYPADGHTDTPVAYNEGDMIFVTGMILNSPDSDVTIQITYDETQVYSVDTQADSNGKFSEKLVAENTIFGESGEYTVIATNNGKTAEYTFDFIAS